MALLGAHVSTSGGLEKAPQRGQALGCEAIQLFTRNQMQWQQAPLTQTEIHQFRDAHQNDARGFPVLSHNSYLINLGCPDPDKRAKSEQAFLAEMARCQQLGVHCIVFHPGAHLGEMTEDQCIRLIADSLNRMLAQRHEDTVTILIENTAGQGSNIGYRFEHLAAILALIEQPQRMGICIDTCHTLAAGYDLTTTDGYHQVMAEIDRTIGLQRIKAFHLNDSKKPLSSRVDRHEHIGQGCVGLDAFRCLVNDSRFKGIPMVLETPGDEIDYQRNLECLKRLRMTN